MTGDLDSGNGRLPGEEPIELRRYLDALRRGLPLIVLAVIAATVAAFVVSLALTKHYRAEASIVRQQLTSADQAQSVDSLTRELNTLNSLLTTDEMLKAAAAKLPGETADSLRGEVDSSVDPNANLIYVTATASDRDRAATIANVVAQTFLTRQASIERRQSEAARAELETELARLRGQPDSALEIQAVESRLSDLNIQIASAGTELALAERATPPASASSPHPGRNAVLGAVLGLLLGSLVALVRDQLAPRAGSARELSSLLGLPVLVAVPRVPLRGIARTSADTAEREAYGALANIVRYAFSPGDGAQLVLVTSAVDGEGKTSVATGLARALRSKGDRTLLVPRDLQHDAAAPLAAHVVDRLLENEGDDGASYVIVDGPPLLDGHDSHALVSRCPNVLFVARTDHVTLEQAKSARDLLDRLECRPIGLVVVGSRTRLPAIHVRGRIDALEDL
jgi:capsular polysaccharide biosynthesis protein